MPLLCTSFFTFLLLPLCLSCDSKRPLLEVVRQYMATVRIDLHNTRESITPMLENVSCRAPKHKMRNCTSNNTDFITGLHNLTCKMKNLNLAITNRLSRSVLGSLQCPCSIKPGSNSYEMEAKECGNTVNPALRKKLIANELLRLFLHQIFMLQTTPDLYTGSNIDPVVDLVL
ncbi:uncharacterized protein V6R79_024006 [Siganus canaliculatus]